MEDYIEKSMGLVRYADGPHPSPGGVERRWHDVFCCVLRKFGFTRKQRAVLWDELVVGNWKRLHRTEEEEALEAHEWLESFRLEVFYCCDRYSFDRLTRCHWLFRQYMRAATSEWKC